MIFGMTPFTFVHVVISLIGIGSGLVVMYGFLAAKRLDVCTGIFLATTVLTSLTGFFLPFEHFMPSHAVGIISLLALAVAIFARYGRALAGPWRTTFVISAAISLYLNVFVLIVQSFLKIPALAAVAPTQSEPPFLVTQTIVLTLFITLAIAGTIRFRVQSASHPI